MFPRRITRTQQPNQPIPADLSIDGLVGLLYPSGAGLIDVLNNNQPSADTSSRRIGKLGLYSDYNSSDQTEFSNKLNYGLASAMTLIVIFDADTLTNYGALISCQDSAATNGFELRLGSGATDGNMQLIRANTDWEGWRVGGASVISAGTKDNFVAISCNDADIGTSPAFYNINGTKRTDTTSASNGGTGNQVASTHSLFVGRRESGVTQLDGAVNLIALFDRALTFNETESIRSNPYGLTQPRTQLLPLTVGVAPPTTIPVFMNHYRNQGIS